MKSTYPYREYGKIRIVGNKSIFGLNYWWTMEIKDRKIEDIVV